MLKSNNRNQIEPIQNEIIFSGTQKEKCIGWQKNKLSFKKRLK